jgi:pantoate--beta-alanine ligase
MSNSFPQTQQITTVGAIRGRLDAAGRDGKKIGLVPTMGALHEGHLSLVRACRSECGFTVVSIYVNPTQFGPGDDLGQYPRTLEADVAALSAAGVDVVFVPSNEEMYPPGHATWVEVGSVAGPLEGRCRPGHFRGVATIVLKLFNVVGPDIAYFGHKDYQQALVIQRVVKDLNVPVLVRVCPTVREADGLAMSSRNRYLSPEARRRALVLWKSLCLAADLAAQGVCEAAEITERMREVILSAGDAQIDYVALVDPETLDPAARVDRPVLAVLAARIGATRLIDNRLIRPPGP